MTKLVKTKGASINATCIGCGCDDEHACCNHNLPCHWLVVDYDKQAGVCSECEEYVTLWDQGVREYKPDGRRGDILGDRHG